MMDKNQPAFRYSNDDVQAVLKPDGQWIFTHKDGRPY